MKSIRMNLLKTKFHWEWHDYMFHLKKISLQTERDF